MIKRKDIPRGSGKTPAAFRLENRNRRLKDSPIGIRARRLLEALRRKKHADGTPGPDDPQH